MFQFLFRYPPAAYRAGHLVLLGSWPVWLLGLAILATALGLSWLLFHGRGVRPRTAAIWALQSLVIALILTLLWEPALSLAQLKPQQNIIAVLVDDSQSMALQGRETQALAALHTLLPQLQRRFQTRVYTFDSNLRRATNLAAITPAAPATLIGASLDQLLQQTADLPLGGVVLLTDGADNAGGLEPATLDRLRARQLPVHTIGFGSTTPAPGLELEDVQLPARALAKSRVQALVQFRQYGHSGQRTVLSVRDGRQLLASQPVTLGADGDTQSVPVLFNSGPAGLKSLEFSLAPAAGETSNAAHALTRVLNVAAASLRILYIEGEPRWDYKFIRRAEARDPQVQLVSMLHATQNKWYRQGISDPSELAEGFPSRAEDLFRYQAILIGSVAAATFTPVQQDLLTAFADRRGGGILFVAGDAALADGGWADSALAPLLPVVLPPRRNTFVRADLSSNNGDPARAQTYAELAPAGADSVITRLMDDPAANANKWRNLPWLVDYQDAGTPKPGASVLANLRTPQGRTLPLLVTETYGRGRTAVLASSGTWRWQMMLPLGDPTHALFWQQLVRWLAAAAPGPLAASVPQSMLYDQGRTVLTADLRDAAFNPASAASVAAHILGPDGLTAAVALHPSADVPGRYSADFTASKPGVYLAQFSAPGVAAGPDATVAFERQDGVREGFNSNQNRPLLQALARSSGGEYWQPSQMAALAAALPYSAAGVTARDNLPLWNLPVLFFVLLLLPLGEWFLRRRWGVV